jgi:predicted nucleic acid-binding protein
MADEPKAVYWDSDVIIHRIQRTPQHIDILDYLTETAEKNNLLIVVSTFTIVEVNRADNLLPLTEEEDKRISDYFENDYIVIRPLSIPIAQLARQIARKFNIKPKDAVHVATAVFWQVPILQSYDSGLCKKTGLIGDPPLKIENPAYIGQGPLFMSGNATEENANPSASAVPPADNIAPEPDEASQAEATMPEVEPEATQASLTNVEGEQEIL